MKTQIIDRTTGGSAEEFKIGMEGYFWDAVFGPVRKGVYAGESCGNLINKDGGEAFHHFSPTIPEWFLPSEAKREEGD